MKKERTRFPQGPLVYPKVFKKLKEREREKERRET